MQREMRCRAVREILVLRSKESTMTKMLEKSPFQAKRAKAYTVRWK